MFNKSVVIVIVITCKEVERHLKSLTNLPDNSDSRRAKLGQIQGGLQRVSQDSTKGGLQYFFTFYALKTELFRVFTRIN